ncbi:MAG: sigma-70 family RNA polymerase sigma factor [Eubacteriales bacterium]|nr:sigma-70 family RNA polymerase sigma factor [Eubacteriales bacterium]
MTGQNNKNIDIQFDSTYEKTNRKVTLFLISKCKNFSDVNDILQDVYLEYYQILMKKGFGYIQNEEKFLISLCKKKMATYYSFWDRIPHKLSLDEKEEFEKDSMFQELCDETDFEDVFFKKEMIEDVKQILLNQPDDIQKIFYLYYTMELKIPEIANLLGIKNQTVKNKLFRTRKLIAQLMKDWR